MGLGIYYKEGITSPELICDTCGKKIDDWRKALVSCEIPSNSEDLFSVGVYHKGECESPGHTSRYVLSSYIAYLLYNHDWGTKRRSEEGAEVVIEICAEVRRKLK